MSSSGDTSNTSVSRSGITTSADGQRHIPSSTRADGSKRREIKIRPGYRPPEDIEVYKNRTAEAWKTRGSSGVPGAAPASEDDTKAGASNKNAKRREARKKAKAMAADAGDGNGPVYGVTENTSHDNVQAEEKTCDTNAEAEKEKKAKRLRKKLREARELQAKKEKGEGLLQEQFEKVIRINELLKDLEKLGVKDQSEDVDDKSTEQ